jgi:excisionase family DNA binding protein
MMATMDEPGETRDQFPAGGAPGWLRTVREESVRIVRELGNIAITIDVEFLAYLRVLSQFGVFQYGPVTIAVSPVEQLFWRLYEPRRGSGVTNLGTPGREFPPTALEMHEFFGKAWTEARRQGRMSVNELDYLVTFMTCDAEVPRRVFSELGVTPERVWAYTARREAGIEENASSPGRLYSPEEAAQYFGVRVETVRSWIRSGRLPAARLAGLKSIRILESDLAAVLNPIRVNTGGFDPPATEE